MNTIGRISPFIVLVLTLLCSASLCAQSYAGYGIYDTDFLPPSFFKSNREKLLRQIGDSAVVVLYSASEHTRNNDVEFQFRQDDDFFYMTGCNEPSALLILSSNPIEVTDTTGTHTVHEILFVESRNSRAETWTGRRLGPYGAIKVLGVESASTNTEYKQALRRALSKAKALYIPLPPEEINGKIADMVRDIEQTTRSMQRSIEIRTPLHLIRGMRQVKSAEELKVMRKGVEISMEGHRQMMRSCKDGMYEYQLQALFEFVGKDRGAEYTAYPCIVGSGENSVILHYNTNRKQLHAGEIIVMDCAMEYHNYATDITRTIPVSGRFTDAQRAIYNIVYDAQEEAMKLVKPGVNYYKEVTQRAGEVIRNGLLQLGVIKDSADYKKYFIHGLGHPVGLDVHDVSSDGVLKEGEVWTVEPGIYIPANTEGVDSKWWNIGVRIEDEVLVTGDGNELLTRALPRKGEDIEKTMQERGVVGK
ncbi:MAG: aminopeptidase P N-terminal domain-containing protein [Ignavibacteriae bacterium]|nr:aminopeptidase P N-terminal domain-containing protein [Ignavibacteria bacterium]MBI3365806.1 aminopeptidase P N-terminal domain-containing protein [Ignavibacteriota bacterium]